MVHLADLCLLGLVLAYSLNLAPMMFESFTSDRIWASNPPDSFHMFLGQYGQKTAHYWRVVSPLAVVTFVLSFIFNWHLVDRMFWLFVALTFYVAVQLATIAYFVPEQEALISHAGSLPREVLSARAHRWIFLNYFRNVAGVLAYAFLMCAVLAPSQAV
jgi:Domain of unknown function (DUF1772)